MKTGIRNLILQAFFVAALLLTPANAALACEPCVVPLEFVNINAGTNKSAEWKLGVYVGLGGGPPQLYEFDTGGGGFWAAYTSTPSRKKRQWWGDFTVLQADALTNKYSSGNEYTASLVNTTVALYRKKGDRFVSLCETSAPTGVAQIEDFVDTKKPQNQAAWYQALANGTPPLFGNFYGDFGAALHPVLTTDGTAGVYSILPQLPFDDLTNGFIVHVGPLGTGKPTLTIGISEKARATFRTFLPMNETCVTANGTPGTPSGSCPAYPNFPINNVSVWSEQVTSANLSWEQTQNGRKHRQDFSNVPLTLDTGAPATTIYQDETFFVQRRFISQPSGSAIPYSGDFKSRVKMMFEAATVFPGIRNLNFTIRTGNEATVNEVAAAAKTSNATGKANTYMNTGLMFYTHYDVMFDVENGVVGFRPSRE